MSDYEVSMSFVVWDHTVLPFTRPDVSEHTRPSLSQT